MRTKRNQKVQIEQKEGQAPVPAKVLAQEIASIGAAMRRLNQTRLKRETVVALIHDRSRIPKKTIEIVLNNLDQLETHWLKKEVA